MILDYFTRNKIEPNEVESLLTIDEDPELSEYFRKKINLTNDC